MTGSNQAPGSVPSSARPVSGNGMPMGGPAANWNQGQQQQMNMAGGMVNNNSNPNNNNTLSYGSLKNRLLPGSAGPAGQPVSSGMPVSGAGKQPSSVQGSAAGGAVAPTNGSGATGTSKSKLFSLAR